MSFPNIASRGARIDRFRVWLRAGPHWDFCSALLNLQTALNRIHNYMQRFAVGLQLIVEDRVKYRTKPKEKNFLTEFNEAQYKLKEVLCELKEGILGRGLKVGVNVDRSIISWEIRKDAAKEPAYRNLRDWYIYRDYMNGLEYAIQTFNNLNDPNKLNKLNT